MLDPLIQTIISKSNIDRFTVVEIRTAYLALHEDQNINPVKVRKLVYSQLYKLVKKGWLSTSTSSNRKITTFFKTKSFDLKELKEICLSNKSDESFTVECYKQLNNFNTELLECIGSLETYAELWKNYPDLHDILKENYLMAQEKQHNLRGKINTLNLLLRKNTEVRRA